MKELTGKGIKFYFLFASEIFTCYVILLYYVEQEGDRIINVK